MFYHLSCQFGCFGYLDISGYLFVAWLIGHYLLLTLQQPLRASYSANTPLSRLPTYPPSPAGKPYQRIQNSYTLQQKHLRPLPPSPFTFILPLIAHHSFQHQLRLRYYIHSFSTPLLHSLHSCSSHVTYRLEMSGLIMPSYLLSFISYIYSILSPLESHYNSAKSTFIIRH